MIKKEDQLKNRVSGKYVTIRPDGTTRVFTVNNEPSMTDQSFKEESNINNIISKYSKTGMLPSNIRTHGSYLDITETKSLFEGLNTINEGLAVFNKLSEKVRRRVETPQGLIEFLSDPENDDEAIKLGLKTRRTSTDEVKTSKKDVSDEKPDNKQSTQKEKTESK